MTEVGFYQLLHTPLEAALPRLLEKAYAAGLRSVVLAGGPDRVEALSALLWTYDPDSFLPHGSALDGMAERQPIWLTHLDENPNQATLLVLVDGRSAGGLGSWQRCLDIFDGRDEVALGAARVRYRAARDGGHTLKYYAQTDRGWELKSG
ncbi:MAG: DNA polymerase III subunit chi [Alphaproteobacteria bacterium]|nr:MAG: DNA polymerase III subunit chi [Alphaproteobacteria bacterium]